MKQAPSNLTKGLGACGSDGVTSYWQVCART
jgi:hypothetical protein